MFNKQQHEKYKHKKKDKHNLKLGGGVTKRPKQEAGQKKNKAENTGT
jgi:hypothetical protein